MPIVVFLPARLAKILVEPIPTSFPAHEIKSRYLMLKQFRNFKNGPDISSSAKNSDTLEIDH